MPALKALCEEYQDVRDGFEILAFHEASAKSFEELDPHLDALTAERWGGKPLPFPILLDATGETVDKLGVSSYPTLLLVDPEGKVVRGASLQLFEAKLQALRSRRVAAGEEEAE